MADVYAADVLNPECACGHRRYEHGWQGGCIADRTMPDGTVNSWRECQCELNADAVLLALVPDGQSLVIDRDGRVWGLGMGSKGYRLVPVTSEEG